MKACHSARQPSLRDIFKHRSGSSPRSIANTEGQIFSRPSPRENIFSGWERTFGFLGASPGTCVPRKPEEIIVPPGRMSRTANQQKKRTASAFDFLRAARPNPIRSRLPKKFAGGSFDTAGDFFVRVDGLVSQPTAILRGLAASTFGSRTVSNPCSRLAAIRPGSMAGSRSKTRR